jgi:hypothetical protein
MDMRPFGVLACAAVLLCAAGATGAPVASAEDSGSPSILCLVKGCQNLEGTLTGGLAKLVAVKNAKVAEAEKSEMSLRNCEAVTGTEEKDIRLCKDVLSVFTNVKVEGTKCNTEGDPEGIALVLFDLHMASETTSASVLEPLLLARILNAKLEALPVTLICGAALKFEVKGTLGCLLLPGLKNVSTTEKLEVLCKLHEKTPETGTCQQLCEWLTEAPFEVNFGSGFEPAWMQLHVEGAPSKDIFIDD